MIKNAIKIITLCFVLTGCEVATYVAADAALNVGVGALLPDNADKSEKNVEIRSQSNEWVCNEASYEGFWKKRPEHSSFVEEAHRRGLDCNVDEENRSSWIGSRSDIWICDRATFKGLSAWRTGSRDKPFFDEAFRRKLSCGILRKPE